MEDKPAIDITLRHADLRTRDLWRTASGGRQLFSQMHSLVLLIFSLSLHCYPVGSVLKIPCSLSLTQFFYQRYR